MIRSSLSLSEAVSMSWIKRAHCVVSCVTRWTESSVAHVFTALSVLHRVYTGLVWACVRMNWNV